MSYAPMYETWRVFEEEVGVDVLLDLGHSEDYPVAGFSWFFCVRLPMTRQGEDGMPDAEEEHRLNLVENRIREVLRNRDGCYVGRRTGAGNRDLVFYLPERPKGVEDRLRASVGTELLFISRADKTWEAYHSMLPTPRDWRQIEDRRVIGTLLDADAHPEALHSVCHEIETPIAKGAEALLGLFSKLELEDCTTDGTAPSITVRGVQRTTLDVTSIHRVSWILESKAPKARGIYLGWTADPVLMVAEEDDDLVLQDDAASELAAILESLAGPMD